MPNDIILPKLTIEPNLREYNSVVRTIGLRAFPQSIYATGPQNVQRLNAALRITQVCGPPTHYFRHAPLAHCSARGFTLPTYRDIFETVPLASPGARPRRLNPIARSPIVSLDAGLNFPDSPTSMICGQTQDNVSTPLPIINPNVKKPAFKF